MGGGIWLEWSPQNPVQATRLLKNDQVVYSVTDPTHGLGVQQPYNKGSITILTIEACRNLPTCYRYIGHTILTLTLPLFWGIRLIFCSSVNYHFDNFFLVKQITTVHKGRRNFIYLRDKD